MGLKVSVGLSESAASIARRDRIAKSLALLTTPTWQRVGSRDSPLMARPLLEQAVAEMGAPGPWPVYLQRTNDNVHGFRVFEDGSVQAFTERSFEEVWPAGTVRTPRLLLLGAHPGCGVSTWTRLLGGVELASDATPEHRTLIVARSTLAGVNAAKAHARKAGAILLVADAPGAVPADVRRGIRVLAGAIGVVRAPWVKALRGVDTTPESTALAKTSATVLTSLAKQWRYTP